MDTFGDIKRVISREIPAEARLTKVEFEGPYIVIYADNPNFLIENSEPIKRIVREIKKRVIVRADPHARKKTEEAKAIISTLIPAEAEITETNFDEGTGEVIILAKKPGLVIGKGGSTLRDIASQTGWRPTIIRSPPLKSRIIEQSHYYQSKENDYRLDFLRKVGRRIHRPRVYNESWITISALGGFREVGRQAIFIQTLDSKVLIDCGVRPGAQTYFEEFPRLDISEFNIEELDAVIVTHAHLDHCGLVPILFKYGYGGPIYCTKPTKSLMTLLQLDYLDVAVKEGKPTPYGLREVKKEMLHTIPLEYGEVTDITPDIRLTLHNAGHILGSAMVHLHIGDGLYNIVYTGDFKYARTRLLEPATCAFPRAETLIMESTYGAPNDIVPTREETEQMFLEVIRTTIQLGGKALIPILAVGRAQEIMLVLDEAIKSGILPQVPIYIEGMLQEVTAIHTAYPEELARELKNRIFHKGENPFLSEHFVSVDDKSARPDIAEGGPCIIMATSGMLTGGPALEYFKLLAPNPNNTMIFVNYQIEGTLGRSILRGLREIPLANNAGRMDVIQVKMSVKSIDGFSGHSDRKQLLKFVNNLSPRPKQVMVVHGEESKCVGMADSVRRFFHVEALAPSIGDRIRVK